MTRIIRRGIILLLTGAMLTQPALGAGPEVPGRSSLLMEKTTGTVLSQHNAHEQLAPASVTKIMTLLLIMEAVDSGRLGWEDPVTASETAAAKGGSQVYLKAGEQMSVSDMVKAIAVSSANDCACAMAEHLAGSEEAFVEQMNEKAALLQMEDTHFVNCTGLDDGPEASAHRTSAWDVGLMSRELLLKHPGIKKFTTLWMDTLRDGTFGLSNTNKLVRFYPGATGLKTGYTSGAGFCLSASAQREGMELIAVVLGAGSSRERFGACRALLDRGFARYTLVSPQQPGEQSVPVILGKEPLVPAEPADRPGLLVEKARTGQLRQEIRLEPSVSAPVSRGQRLGTLTLLAGEQILARIPLVAAREVQRLTFRDLWLETLRRASMGKKPE